MTTKSAPRAAPKGEKTWLEWAVFGVGLALVLGVLGYLAYDGATAAGGPPVIEVTLEAGGGEPERGEFTVAFLPRQGRREGWVAFGTDPRAGRLTPRVLGYEKP